MSDNRFMKEALRLAELGYKVFPCIPGQKKPLTKNGFHDASSDPDQIKKWWTEHPNANVAVPTDGLVVVDVDGKGEEWLGDQDERWEDLAKCPSSQTPRGGRHFIFRQPVGNAWRNTQSELAPKVDTRANGGYILVPPSVTENGSYRWLPEYELDVPPDQLPEPKHWLIEQLDKQKGQPSQIVIACPADAIREGGRNGTLARLAGTMRRVGMSRAAIEAALQRTNCESCKPPLPSSEVAQVAEHISKYQPHELIGKTTEQLISPTESIAPPMPIGQLIEQCPDLRPPVIHGLARMGETINVIAPPKLGKSWLVNDLGLAVASGRLWLGFFNVEQGNVLILDNELHQETSANRIPRVAQARDISPDEYEHRLFISNLRGQLLDVFSLGPYFDTFAVGQFSVIVLDAFYRFMPIGMDENDNGTMASLYNCLDKYAARLGCCFVLIHHTSKGSQSGKSITDVGAGAGTQSRATDTHLVLRPHAESDCVVLDAAVRSWPPVQPFVLRWRFPLFDRATDLDPKDLKSEKPKGGLEKKMTVDAFVKKFITDKPVARPVIIAKAKTAGLKDCQVKALLLEAEGDQLIHRHQRGRNTVSSFSIRPADR